MNNISYETAILMGPMGVDKPLEMIYAVCHNHPTLELQVIYFCMRLYEVVINVSNYISKHIYIVT